MSKILDYFVLSFILAVFFTMGYVFTASSMLILYALVYAISDKTETN